MQNTKEDSTKDGGETAQTGQKEISKGKKLRNNIIELCIYIAVIVICVAFVPRYVLQRTIVDGKSMMNTLKNGENLLVEKVSYHFTDPDRFDVIVFYPHGRDSSDYYIKRVIGLPGETIQIIDEDIYIDGEKLEENFGKDPIIDPGMAEEPIKLGDDEFFVLGDNRTVSEDSRYEEVGPVKRVNIEGRAVLRIYPLSEFGTFE
ncbi:MAG TPA: signal peptidase I [Lachnospiraceae bacterium]|nr:signal peptidase I [Lachnospiraceae bacterium]